MTLAVRNTILVAGVAITALLLLGYLVTGYLVIFGPYADEVFAVSSTQTWFGLRWSVPAIGAFRGLAAAGVLGLIAVVSAIIAVRVFRRVSSAEIYFMVLFVMSLAVELIRIAQPLLDVADAPIFWGVVVTRLVLFGRLVGSLALFTAGVYAAGADYPRIGSVTLIVAAISFLIVYFVPVDSTRMNASFVHVAGGRTGVDLMLGFLSLAAVANYLISWLRSHREGGAGIVLAVTAMVIGKHLVLHVPTLVALTAGLVLVAAGIANFLLVNRSYYLWY